jgi:hypothetical protein
MTPRVPLPPRDSLPEWVFFHREHPSDKRIVLQVPNEDQSDSATFVVDTEDTIHRAWMEGLANHARLRDLLSYAQHAAFCPRTGYVEEIPDFDAPSDTAIAFAYAQMTASYMVQQRAERMQRRLAPPMSQLRMFLTQRGVR